MPWTCSLTHWSLLLPIAIVLQQAITQNAAHLPPRWKVHMESSCSNNRGMMQQNGAEVAGICLSMEHRWAVQMRWHQHFWDITMTSPRWLLSIFNSWWLHWLHVPFRSRFTSPKPAPDTYDVAHELQVLAPLAVRVDKVCHVHPAQKPAFCWSTENDGSFHFNETRTWMQHESMWAEIFGWPQPKMDKNGMNTAKTSDYG